MTPTIPMTLPGGLDGPRLRVATYNIHKGVRGLGPRKRLEIHNLGLGVEALDADPELAEAFHALTPGRQRSYSIALASAKTAETRFRRIAGFRAGIMAGLGANGR